MMRPIRKNRKLQLDNKGFSLVELLVAMIILAIIVVPLLHTFISSARTNARAKQTMRATTIAENLMEEFIDADVGDMLLKYGGVEDKTTGICTFSIPGGALLSEHQTTDYRVDVELNPTVYAARNSDNVIDVDAITLSDCGIYSMPLDADDVIYDLFTSWNQDAHTTDASYVSVNRSEFEENLERSIMVKIINRGMTTDAENKQIPLVRVTLTIEYNYVGGLNALRPENRTYTETKEIFDNASAKKELSAVYLMFTPRYKAFQKGHPDIITIENLTNIPAKAYVIKEKIQDEATQPGFLSYRPSVTIVENPTVTTPNYTPDTEGAISLRTNLHSPFGSGSVNLKCDLLYKNSNGSKSASGDVAGAILHIRAADGRTLDNVAVKRRIYEMKVSVIRNGATSPLVTLNGTKME